MRKSYYRILMFIMTIILSMSLYAQEMINAVPDQNNQKVIRRYNRYRHRPWYSTSPAFGYTAVFGVKSNSIMSTEDIEVNVVKRWVQDAAIDDNEHRLYFVEITNKTDQPLYIDKSHCFRIYHDGSRFCYFDPNRDDTCTAQRIITIPPHSKKNLSDYSTVLIKKDKVSELKIIDFPEEFNWDAMKAGVCEGFLSEYEVRTFSEDHSPYYRSLLISYSKDKDFSTYSILPINFYIRQLIGNFLPELYQSDHFFEKLGADQYTITNCEFGYGGVNRYRVEN